VNTIAAPQTSVFRFPVVSAYRLVISYVLLLPLIFFAVRGSFSFQYAETNNGTNGAYGSLVNPSAGKGSLAHSAEMLLVYGIALLAMAPIWKQMVSACRQNKLLLALPAWAILSTFWSQEPSRTAAFALMALVNTVFALYLAERFRPNQQLQLFLLAGTVLALVSLAVIIVYPNAGVDHKNATIGWQGIFPHKNICALVMVAFLLPAFIQPFRGKFSTLKRTFYIVLLTVLIAGTTSRTGWIVGALSIAFVYFLKMLRRTRKLERAVILFVVPSVLATLIGVVAFYKAEILALLGKSSTLSGRTIIWAAVFLSILKRPFLGFGYDAFWIGFKGEAVNLALATGDTGLSNAENGILQLWLEIGLVGVLLLSLLLLRTCRNAIICFRSDSPGYVIWYISLLFITLLALVDGDKFMFPHAIEWTMYVLADAGLAMEAKRILATSTA
jgi:exopolysaccharide production protein ExoQ